MNQAYYVIEITPGRFHIRAGETTDDIDKARQYATSKGARCGLGLARKWDMLPEAKIIPMTCDVTDDRETAL